MNHIFRRFTAALLAVILFIGLVYTDAHAVSASNDTGYGYTFLSTEEKAVYEIIRDSIANVDSSVKILALTEQQLFHVMEMVIADHPELFWFTGGYGYSVQGGIIHTVAFRYQLNGASATRDEILVANTEFQAAIQQILKQMKLEAGSDDYSKAVWLHDQLAQIITYEFGPNHQTAYGAVVDGKAVCAGYARSYQYLLQCAGIQAWTVKGTSVNPSTGYLENHAWNLLWLNGKCVYVDLTWNDQDPELFHLYFGNTLSEISVGHFVEEAYYQPKLPECKCTNAGYFDVYRPDCDVSETITVDKVVGLLTPRGDGMTWVANLYDSGNHHVDIWLQNQSNLRAIINRAFGVGKYSMCITSLASVGNGYEYHLSVTRNEIGRGVILSGTVKSSIDSNESVTLQLIHNKTVCYTTTVVGNNASYVFDNVVSGTYTLRILKDSHITKEYTVKIENSDVTMDVTISSMGDVNGDNKINMKDWSRLYNHINEIDELEGYDLTCADVNGDGKVNMKDWNRMYDHINETNPLW